LGVGLGAAVAHAASPRDQLAALRAKLAASRQRGRSSGWAAELKFAAAQSKTPELAAEVIYEVARSQAARDASEAAKTLGTLLKNHPKVEPWASLATYDLAAAYAESSATRQKAIELYETFLKLDCPDPVRRANARLALGRLYKDASKPDKAIETLRAFLDQFPQHTKGCAEALATMGLALVERKQVKDAHVTYKKLSTEYPWELELRRTLLTAVAQGFRTSGEGEAAIAAYGKLLEELPASDSARSQIYTGLAMLHIQQKDTEKAIATYRRMAEDSGLSSTYRASAYRQLFDIYRRADDAAAIIRLAYQVIAAEPSRILESGNILGELVDALIGEGRVDEAIGMAKAYYRLTFLMRTYSSSSSSYKYRTTTSQGAIFTVVRALKAKEGSLLSANKFIAYVEQGPEGPDGRLGTPDDIQDPTAAYRLPADAERDGIFTAAAKRFVTDPHRLGYLYICWDKPDEALLAFRRHYLTASESASAYSSSSSRRASSGLQSAASLLARAMRAVGRPEADVDAFFEFQNYGPDGKDGKPKTKDDLKDPIVAKK
jgi:TolA-binding protein